MTEPFIKHAVVYDHPDDPDFETSCEREAQAYAKVYPLVPWLRKRLTDSGRFSNDSTLEGALKRDKDLLLEYETIKLKGPADFFGMDDQQEDTTKVAPPNWPDHPR